MIRLFGVILSFFLIGQSAMAATLYLDPAVSTLSRGDAEIISVRLDTDEASDECINAVEGVVQLNGPVSAVDVSLGNSIFSIWVEPPTIGQDGKQVTFAGGIPNGYCGRIAGDPRLTNNLFDIVVRTTAIASVDGTSAIGTINFTEQTTAYLNDGFGTVAALQTFPKEITVLPELSTDVLDPWRDLVSEDTISPQEFSITLGQTSPSLRDRYYITFSTTDKQTGIDRYEVIEEPLSRFSTFTWGSASAPWIEARSPYVLKDQSLNSIIRVKAVDKAGNEYIATYVPDEAIRTTPLGHIALLTLLVISVLVFVYGLFSFYQKRRQQKSTAMFDQINGELDRHNHHYQPEEQPTVQSDERVADTQNDYDKQS